MKKINVIKAIKSNEFAIFVAILSVLVQSFHSFTAFYNMSSLKGSLAGIIQAVLFAVVVDLAILFYTVRGKRDVVMFASVFLFVINGYYYFDYWGVSYELIFAAFLSILVPVTQYYYSEEIKDEDDEINPYHYARIIEDKDEEIDRIGAELQKAITDNGKLELRISELEKINNHQVEQWKEVESDFKKLLLDYDDVVDYRDKALNSNAVLSEALGRRVQEVRELKKRLGEIPEDQPLDAEAEVKKIEEEISDTSLLNVESDGAYNPTTSVKPIV